MKKVISVVYATEIMSRKKECHSISRLYVEQPRFKPLDEANEEINALNLKVAELTNALNETRVQVQALLDYCFTSREGWKEGQATKNKVREDKIPESEIPEDKVPEDKIPESEVPEDKISEDKVPESEIPENKARDS